MHVQPDGIIVASTHAGLGNQLLHALSVAVMTHHLRRALNHRLRCTIQLQPWQYGPRLLDVLNASLPNLHRAFQHCDLQMAMPGSARTAREQLVGGHSHILTYDGKLPLTTKLFGDAWARIPPRAVELRPPASYRGGCSVPGLLKIEEMPYAVFWRQMRQRAELLRPSKVLNFTLCLHLRGRDYEHSRFAGTGWYASMASRIAVQRREALAVANRLAGDKRAVNLFVSSSFPQIFARSTNITTHRALLALSRVVGSSALTHRNAVSNLMRLCTCVTLVPEESPKTSTYTLLAELICGMRPCRQLAKKADASNAWQVLCHDASRPSVRDTTPSDCDRSDAWR